MTIAFLLRSKKSPNTEVPSIRTLDLQIPTSWFPLDPVQLGRSSCFDLLWRTPNFSFDLRLMALLRTQGHSSGLCFCVCVILIDPFIVPEAQLFSFCIIDLLA